MGSCLWPESHITSRWQQDKRLSGCADRRAQCKLRWHCANTPCFTVNSNAQVATFERAISLRALSEHPAWQGADVWDVDRMLIPVSEEQWDVVIDMAADMRSAPSAHV